MPRVFVSMARSLPLVALCALGAHTALYGAWQPADPRHAYLAWYDPIVAGLALTALSALVGLVLVAAAARRRPWLAARARRLLGVASSGPAGARLAYLVGASAAWLALQESIEHSLGTGHMTGPGVSGLGLAGSALLIVLLALAVVVVERSLLAVAAALLVGVEPLPRPRRRRTRTTPRPAPARRRLAPLASGAALRAPPA